MLALTSQTLMNTVSDHYCDYRRDGLQRIPAIVLAVTHAQDKYGSEAVRTAIVNEGNIKLVAVAAATVKCPQNV